MQRKKIKLVYWNKPNFGDILSPYIIHKLSQQEIQYKDYYHGFWGCCKDIIKKLLTFKAKSITNIHFPFDKNILGIGSIIAQGNKHSIIWGSGFINESETFKGGNVLAVRGHATNEKIIKQGFSGCNVFGDPALLIPLLISPNPKPINKLGIIPHVKETDYFIKKFSHKYKIIDLRTYNIEQTIQEITGCKYVLSTSLHGIIVSHAYNIPALWIKHGYIDTDGFKFRDYFSSVNIQAYNGFTNIDELLNNEYCWEELFQKYNHLALPQKDIKTIQKQLLEVAPFPINLKL